MQSLVRLVFPPHRGGTHELVPVDIVVLPVGPA